jgi:hypothetical protein
VLAASKKVEEVSSMFSTISTIMGPLMRQSGEQSVTFEISWDIDDFFSEEIEGKKDFAPVLTLTGTIEKAYASSCEDYVQRFWPSFGMEMIRRVLPFTLAGVAGSYALLSRSSLLYVARILIQNRCRDTSECRDRRSDCIY